MILLGFSWFLLKMTEHIGTDHERELLPLEPLILLGFSGVGTDGTHKKEHIYCIPKFLSLKIWEYI